MKSREQRDTTGSVTHPHDAARAPLSRSSKIDGTHLAKLAVVYVRQSSPHQVLENRESTARQYELVDYAIALGWPREPPSLSSTRTRPAAAGASSAGSGSNGCWRR